MELNLSITGLSIQTAGVLLITILSFLLARFLRRPPLIYWTIGWVCLSIGLGSLSLAFRPQSHQTVYLTAYYLGEYLFCFFLLAGCRSHSTGERVSESDARLIIPLLLFGLALGQVPVDYNYKFIPHFAVMAGFFWQSFKSLRPARRNNGHGIGIKVISAGLLLLAVGFLHYVPVFTLSLLFDNKALGTYLSFTSVFDLITKMLLGFGMVMVMLEEVRQEVEAANRKLVLARDLLEAQVRMDPLSEALNRHAFYSLLERRNSGPLAGVKGCVLVIDIDDLKPINDGHGHAAGDAAIRELARSLRAVVRADDLIFRWGGDEFLILVFDLPVEDIPARMRQLEERLLLTILPGTDSPVPVRFSYGVASFDSVGEIEEAVDQADAAMYVSKQARKSSGTPSPVGTGQFD